MAWFKVRVMGVQNLVVEADTEDQAAYVSLSESYEWGDRFTKEVVSLRKLRVNEINPAKDAADVVVELEDQY